MSIEIPALASGALLALAVFAHAWVHRISGPPPVINIVGWVLSILFILLCIASFTHC